MTLNIFDVGIIGLGVAGAFAIYRLSKEHKNIKIIGFDLGRPPLKRRRQIDGWLGCLPNSDGKLYHTDADRVSQIVGTRKTNSSMKLFTNIINNVNDFKTIKDRAPAASLEKRLKKSGYDVQLNNYSQLYPKDIHALSKFMAENIETNKNVSFSFDNEVLNITKQKNVFTIHSNDQEYKCKKIIICVGRSGWRWASELYNNFGIIEDNNIAKYGIRVEMPASNLKEFNKSNLTLQKNNIEIGPFNWNGTVIPEDHLDLAISSFRSNENRWKSDKVSFQFIGNIEIENKGYQQTDRIGKLTFILTNDRINKEKVSLILNDKSKISIIPEYEWIKKDLIDFGEIVPDILTKAYFHVPTIVPLPPKINIGSNLETEVNGMYVAGESAGTVGILSAALMGLICANEICK
jgi:hypothetical protein